MAIPIIGTMKELFNDPGLFTITILVMAFSIVALLIFFLIKGGLFENISLTLRSSPSGAGNSNKKKSKSKSNSGNEFKEDLEHEFKSGEVAASENSQSYDDFSDEDFGKGNDDFSDEGAQNKRIDEIENRLNTVENKVEDVSDNIQNIKEENKSAIEQLDDMQADVSKLLEIYGVISEGINPFVGGGEETEGFDLFDQAPSPEEPEGFEEEPEGFEEEPEGFEEEPEPKQETAQKEPIDPSKEKGKETEKTETKNPNQNYSPNQSPPKPKENIYLNKLTKDFKTDLIVLKWVKHLKKFKQDNLNKLLNYYVDIGWVSNNVRNNLLIYSRGITKENKKNKNEITINDHIKSLKYIAKIYEDEQKENDLKEEIENLKTINEETNKEPKTEQTK